MEDRDPLRVVVFTCGQLGYAAADMIAGLEGVESVTIVHTPYRTRRRSGFTKLRHAYEYGGLAGMIEGPLNWLRRLVRHNEEDRNGRPVSPSIRVLAFDDFHDAACVRALQEIGPDLGVVVGTYILKPSVFALPRLGSINLHTGKAPEYRGSAPGFWEMYNGERRVGITIHWVAAEVDAGAIICQEVLPFDSAPKTDPMKYIEGYQKDVLAPKGLRLLVEAVTDIVAGRSGTIQQDPAAAHTYRMPTYQQQREMRRRVAERRGRSFNRVAKTVLGWLLFRSGMYRLLTRGKAFIVLFHRVDDRYAGNPISCTAAEFNNYCQFFSRYFQTASASELVGLLENNGDLSGRLVITFDDGYADNVEAGATMRRHGLQGCFFIATDFIGTNKDGWWDVKNGHHSRWMSWDDVRQLHAWGFEIGAHTRTHIDLGAVSGPAALDEVVGSMNALEKELGAPVLHFAYPFGGRTNITAENVGMIRENGFRTCMSAYGGTIAEGSDPFDLQRYAISPWHRSPWQLGWELLLEPGKRG